MTSKAVQPCHSGARGFSLIELAVALALLGILLTGVMVPLITQIGQHKRTMTQKTLDEIKDALLGFAAANGRLPCPAVGNAAGDEAFATTGTPGSAADGRCRESLLTAAGDVYIGFLPGRALGITPVDTDGYALDGWETRFNRVRYAVSARTIALPTTPATNLTNPFTRTDGIRTATMGEISRQALLNPGLLHVCDRGDAAQAGVNCNPANTLTSTAVAVIWSLGANAATGGTGLHEGQNPNTSGGSADRLFVSRTFTDATPNPFDDVVTWLSFNTLVNRMVAAGQLP
jgi:prepilin-type N-terminal cleavage/methylation domain-containing protein